MARTNPPPVPAPATPGPPAVTPAPRLGVTPAVRLPSPEANRSQRREDLAEAARHAVQQLLPPPSTPHQLHDADWTGAGVADSLGPYQGGRALRLASSPSQYPPKSARPAVGTTNKHKRHLDRLRIKCSLQVFANGYIKKKAAGLGTTQVINLHSPTVYEDLHRSLCDWVVQRIQSHEVIGMFTEEHFPYMYLGQGKTVIEPEDFNAVVTRSEAMDIIFDHQRWARDHGEDSDDADVELERLPTPRRAPVLRSQTRAELVADTPTETPSTPSRPFSTSGDTLATGESLFDAVPGDTHLTGQPPWVLPPPNPQLTQDMVDRMGSVTMTCYVEGLDSHSWLSGHRLELDPFGFETNCSPGLQLVMPIRLCRYRMESNESIADNPDELVYNVQVLDRTTSYPFTARQEPRRVEDKKKGPTLQMRHYYSVAQLLAGFAHSMKLAPHKTIEMSKELQGIRVASNFMLYEDGHDAMMNSVVTFGSADPSDLEHYDAEGPSVVYFFEERLVGPVSKWSTLDNFTGTKATAGTAMQVLMDAFAHWTYVQSKGQRIVACLQGVGNCLTNPQIIDLDPRFDWGPRNNGPVAMDAFLAQHRCHRACHGLGLFPLKNLNFSPTPRVDTAVNLSSHQVGQQQATVAPAGNAPADGPSAGLVETQAPAVDAQPLLGGGAGLPAQQ